MERAGGPGEDDLAEMVAALQRLSSSLHPCEGPQCDELTQLERATRHLRAALEKQSAAASSTAPPEPLRRAQELADTLRFDVPVSHRQRGVGQAVRAAKGAAVQALKPFHVEMLRPQHTFNLELVDTLRGIEQNRGAQSGIDLRSWVMSRLGGLADPTTWSVQTHRGNLAGKTVRLAKQLYLGAVGPLVSRPFERQAQWNALALELTAEASVGATGPGPQALLRRLETVCDPLAGELSPALELSAPLWREVFRRQTAFNHQVVDVLAKLLGLRRVNEPDYAAWLGHIEPELLARTQQDLTSLTQRPLFSVVSVLRDTPEPALAELLDSLRAQLYDRWELILVDDGSRSDAAATVAQAYAKRDTRIRLLRAASSEGFARATRRALEQAQGEFVGFIGHQDRLAPHALAQVALRLARAPDADLVYSDEDQLSTSGARQRPFFKPDWSPDLLRACNYLGDFTVVRRSLLETVGGLRDGFDGAHAYDLSLRVSEQARRIEHVPHVLYHRREHPAPAPHAAARALREHLARLGEAGEVRDAATTGHRIAYPVRGKPLVSIIVPFKDKPELLKQLVDSLLAKTGYAHFELLLVSNDSVQPQTHALLKSLKDPRIRVLHWDFPFNYPAINNFGVEQAKGELLLFLNNDIEVMEEGWLEELVGQAQRPEVGAVGPRLLYPNGTLQHAGVVVGMGGFAGHVFAGLPAQTETTHFGRPDWARNFLALTSAALMMRRDVFRQLGGFDERFALCGSDVDLCLKAGKAGLRVVYTPHATLVHHESATRGTGGIPEADFWLSYAAYLPWLRAGDPYFNPNLSLHSAVPALREDRRSGDALAMHYLANELPSSRVRPVHAARIAHQRHAAEHAAGMDYSAQQVAAQRHHAEQLAQTAPKAVRRIHWFVPYFRHPFGGVHTLLRFAHQWKERHGIENTLVVYDNPHATEREMQARAALVCGTPPGAFKVLKRREEVQTLGECDLALASFWTSAYLVLEHPKASVRGYFVQDFEPLFYAAGTSSALAENTYRMGLYGIFNTRGLHDFVTSNYPMRGTWFEPSVDHALFHAQRPPHQGPVRVFFYGRPSVDRNAFELGLESLRRLKAELKGAVDIVTAGEAWSPEQYGARDVIRNLGVLPYERTAELYRSIDVGVAFMFTKHPSYLPLELMASGVTVVSNDNPANAWLFSHERNCLLAEPTVSCVTEQLLRASRDGALRERLGSAAAERLRATTWEAEAERVYQALGEVGSTQSLHRKVS